MKVVMKNILLVMLLVAANSLQGNFDPAEAYRILAAENLYAVLGVAEDASGVDIKKAYYRLSRIYHDDKLANETQENKKLGKEIFERILEAYNTLSNQASKIEYDRLQEATNKFDNNFKILLALYAKNDASFQDQAAIFLKSAIDSAHEDITHKAWLLFSYMFDLNDLYQKAGFPALAPAENEMQPIETKKKAIEITKNADFAKANEDSNSMVKRNYYYKKGLDEVFTLAVLDEKLRIEYFDQWLNWLEMLYASDLAQAKEKYNEMNNLINVYFINRAAISAETQKKIDEFALKLNQVPAEEPPAEEPVAEEPQPSVDVAELHKYLVSLEVEFMALKQVIT